MGRALRASRRARVRRPGRSWCPRSPASASATGGPAGALPLRGLRLRQENLPQRCIARLVLPPPAPVGRALRASRRPRGAAQVLRLARSARPTTPAAILPPVSCAQAARPLAGGRAASHRREPARSTRRAPHRGGRTRKPEPQARGGAAAPRKAPAAWVPRSAMQARRRPCGSREALAPPLHRRDAGPAARAKRSPHPCTGAAPALRLARSARPTRARTRAFASLTPPAAACGAARARRRGCGLRRGRSCSRPARAGRKRAGR